MNTWNWSAATVGSVVVVAACVAAGEPAVIAAVKADQARLAAMMAGDGDALSALLSDQLRFVHSDGRVESKAEYVKNLMAGDTEYRDAKTTEVETMQVANDVVVVLGAQSMRKRLGPDWSNIQLRYLAVYRYESGTWRMVAWQSARPSGNSVVPKKSADPR
jgi:hypothetical protein